MLRLALGFSTLCLAACASIALAQPAAVRTQEPRIPVCDSPLILGRLPVPGQMLRASIQGDLVHIVHEVDGVFRLSLFDISDPSDPIQLGHADLPPNVKFVEVNDSPDEAHGPFASGATVLVSGYNEDDFQWRSFYDVSDPLAPQLVSEETNENYLLDAIAYGELLILAEDAHPDRVRLLDTSAPGVPAELATIELSSFGIDAIAATDETLYIATGRDLLVYDISNPLSPVEVAFLTDLTYGFVDDAFTSGSELYLTELGGRGIVMDITESSAPALPREFSLVNLFEPIPGVDELHIVVSSGVALYAGVFFDLGRPSPYDPDAFLAFATLDSGVEGDFMPLTAVAQGDLAVVLDQRIDGGFMVVDLGYPLPRTWTRSSPELNGLFAPGADVSGIELSGDTAYITNFYTTQAFSVVDVTNPSLPRLLGVAHEHPTDPDLSLVSPTGVKVRDGIAYVADDRGLMTIDVQNPSSPTILGRFDPRSVTIQDEDGEDVNLPYDQALQVWVEPSVAYIADVGEGLIIVDISDPSAPTYLAHVNEYFSSEFNEIRPIPGVFDLQVKDDIAYVSTPIRPLIFDVSDPANPVLLSDGFRYEPSDVRAWEIHVVDDLMYVAARRGGLVVIDVADPSDPVQIGWAPGTIGDAKGIHVEGCLAYVADYGSPSDTSPAHGLAIFDISNPTRPFQVGHHPTIGGALELVARDGVVFIADHNRGLEVIETVLPRPCRVDLLPDWGVIDFDDVLAFLEAFADRDRDVADLNRDRDFDFDDILLFLTESAACYP